MFWLKNEAEFSIVNCTGERGTGSLQQAWHFESQPSDGIVVDLIALKAEVQAPDVPGNSSREFLWDSEIPRFLWEIGTALSLNCIHVQIARKYQHMQDVASAHKHFLQVHYSKNKCSPQDFSG